MPAIATTRPARVVGALALQESQPSERLAAEQLALERAGACCANGRIVEKLRHHRRPDGDARGAFYRKVA